MTNFTIQENEAQYNKQIQEFINTLCDELGRNPNLNWEDLEDIYLDDDAWDGDTSLLSL
jgi:hypothetical protein